MEGMRFSTQYLMKNPLISNINLTLQNDCEDFFKLMYKRFFIINEIH